MSKSQLEDEFLNGLDTEMERTGIKILPPIREFRFHDERKWQFDFAWPLVQVAVEIEGGTWSGGRHSRGAGMAADCDKYNAATAKGWKVLRFTSAHLRTPDIMFELILEAMGVFAEEPTK